MKALEKWTKTEAALLVLTLLFLTCTAAVWMHQRTDDGGSYVIRAVGTVQQEEAPEEGAEDAPEVPVPLEPTADTPLNINTATASELCMLPGIGEVLAGRIVADREEKGPFTEKSDLMRVSGIGEGIYGNVEDLITVGEAEA